MEKAEVKQVIELEVYFPVFKRENQLRIENRFCDAISQMVQVRVNEHGVCVACVLSRVGCQVFKGKIAPHDKKCLLGEKGEGGFSTHE